MKIIKTIKVSHVSEIPKNYTGIIEYSWGTKEWYLNGELHREDEPAVVCPDGHKEYWLQGKRHRKNGPAIEMKKGTKLWFLNGERHREDGPAAIFNGVENRGKYFFYGKLLNKNKIEQFLNLGYPIKIAIKLALV